MKRVLNFENSVDIVDISTITDNSNIGIKWNGGHKNIIVMKNDGEFVGMADDSLSVAYSWAKKTKREYIIQALKQEPEVFVFESKKELLTWFIKED